jgi:hypothetical protein
MDALAGDTQARTPVELNLSSLFQRQYPSVYDGLDGRRYDEPAVKAWLPQVASTLGHEGFRLVGVDHLPKPRPYANKVADRSFARPGLRQRAGVHQPTPIRGNKPVTIGHDYSVVGQIVDTVLSFASTTRTPGGHLTKSKPGRKRMSAGAPGSFTLGAGVTSTSKRCIASGSMWSELK